MVALLSEAVDQLGRGGQARVSRETGISDTMLSRMLRGEKVVTLTEADRICTVLALRLEDVVRQARQALAGQSEAEPAYTIQRIGRNGDGQGPVKVSPEPGKRRTRRLASSPTPPDLVEED